MDTEAAKAKISELVSKYKGYEARGMLKGLGEPDTKRVFIEPLLEALGWNMKDLGEVSMESNVLRTRADYAFMVSGVFKFFLEAKAVNVELEEKEAEQSVDYAYYKSVPWAVLTNFRELIIYNAEAKYNKDSRFLKFTLDDYVSRLGELLLLGKEAFASNEIDTYAEKVGKKIKPEPVGKALLNDLMAWRKALSNNIMEHSRLNKLSKEQVDEGVQKLLNRFVFIRTCEGLGIENERLRESVRIWRENGKKKLMRHLREVFDDFIEWYDSDLFSPHFAGELYIDDAVVEKLIDGEDGLYKWDFSAIDVDVLGGIYEQYLATILRESGRLVAKEANRKEMGIYYTPRYIVDYIVKNTLGEVLKGADTPEKLQKIKVLDPACGSGSFLIRAYGMFADAYRKAYGGDSGMLTEDISRNAHMILTKNIHGVDLDKKAIEISELNLLLKAVETSRKRGMFPLLSGNIKNGNSLISGKEEELKKYFGEKWDDKKPLNWDEQFPDTIQYDENGNLKEGYGFDVVIGNPPYVRVDSLDKEDKEFWKDEFIVSEGKYDLYYLFIEQSLKLIKKGGYLGFILPNKFCAAASAKKLRELLLNSSEDCSILSVSHLDIFKDASNYPVIILIRKGEKLKNLKLGFIRNLAYFLNNKFEISNIKNNDLSIVPYKVFPINSNQKAINLVLKLESQNGKLSDILQISEGFRIPVDYEEKQKNDFGIVKQYQFEKWGPIREGTYISKHHLMTVAGEKSERLLNSFKDKLIIAEDALTISATIDFDKRIPQGGVYFATLIKDIELKYILGILNSKLLSFVYNVLFGGMHMGGGYMRYRSEFLDILPVVIDSNRQIIIKLIDNRLSLAKKFVLLSDKQTDEKIRLEKEIQKLDNEIDEEVYKLYDITDEERKIIEESLE